MQAYITALEYYLPERILDNRELEKLFPDWNAEKVFDKLGIERRHIAGDNESASDMATKAAEKLFANNQDIRREDIDFILFCTQSPDYMLPSSACIIQDRLNLSSKSGALDFNLGCSGWVYGLGLAKGLIASGSARNILLLTGETYTKYINSQDKSNRSIFGDGASAALITGNGGGVLVGDCVYGTDGSRFGDLILKPEGLYMNGGNIFAFSLEVVPGLVESVMRKNDIHDADLYIFHQANKFMLESLRRKMHIPNEKFFVCMSECANTVSNTIPIALKQALSQGKIAKGSRVIIAGFGVGLSWSGSVLYF